MIIQGRYDIATPAETAWDLHRAWPEAQFIMVPDAGHAFSEPGITASPHRSDGRFCERVALFVIPDRLTPYGMTRVAL